jgi:hypothetical protein
VPVSALPTFLVSTRNPHLRQCSFHAMPISMGLMADNYGKQMSSPIHSLEKWKLKNIAPLSEFFAIPTPRPPVNPVSYQHSHYQAIGFVFLRYNILRDDTMHLLRPTGDADQYGSSRNGTYDSWHLKTGRSQLEGKHWFLFNAKLAVQIGSTRVILMIILDSK